MRCDDEVSVLCVCRPVIKILLLSSTMIEESKTDLCFLHTDGGSAEGLDHAADLEMSVSTVQSSFNKISIWRNQQRSSSSYPPLLVALPLELTSMVMAYLSARQVLKVEVTCRHLLLLIRDPKGSSEILWQSIVSRHWPFTQGGGGNSNGWSSFPSRESFLYLRNLRLRPMASKESFVLDCPDRTPSLRSVPQHWSRRSSPFAPRTEVKEVVPLASVEECDHHAEPAVVLPPRGDLDFVERYNFAVLESGGNTFSMTRQCRGWEVDFELCYAGWNGGLLGIVAVDPGASAAAAATSVSWGQTIGNKLNIFCFDFTPNGQEFDDLWWDRDLEGHRFPVYCDVQNAAVGFLRKSESPTRAPRRFRLRFDCRRRGTLELFLLGDDSDGTSNKVVRFVASIGGDVYDEDNNDSIANERMRTFAAQGCDFRPFLGFSPLDPNGLFHLEPEKSFARVLRVMYI